MLVQKTEYSEVPLSKSILTSSAAHFLLILLLFVLGLIQGKILDNVVKENLILVESSVRVDVVAMPRMTKKELEAMQLPQGGAKGEEGSVEESQAPDTKNTFLKKGKSFADLLKDISKKDVAKKKQKGKKGDTKSGKEGLDNKSRSDLRDLVLAGNKISKGTSLTGGSQAVKSVGFVKYIQAIPAHVRPKWTLPSYLLNQELKCRIRIYIGENGKLLKAEIFESSGNSEYDQRALSAVKRSTPFPSPEKEIVSNLNRGELVLGFPL